MPAYRDKAWKQWRYRKVVRLADGSCQRISGTPAINTKVAAEHAERLHIQRVLSGESVSTPKEIIIEKEAPTLKEFAPKVLELKKIKCKRSYYQAMESALRVHLLPAVGALPVDQIDYDIVTGYMFSKLSGDGGKKLSPKSVCNHLSYLRQCLVQARKHGYLEALPEFEWPKLDKSDWDFLTFEEADKVVSACDSAWQPMIVLALNTGMRCGELCGLHWSEVDWDKHQLRVVNNFVRGEMTSPKTESSKRIIPLNEAALAALRAARHLRGPLVFCQADGKPVTRHQFRKGLARACRLAKVREVTPHTLRHTFASHLVIRNQTLKATQELLGHSTIQMTMRYAHLSREARHEAVAALDVGRKNFVAKGCQRPSPQNPDVLQLHELKK